MNLKLFKISIICFFVLLITGSVFAHVHTVHDKKNGRFDDIYIIGNNNFYPIEYYNHDTEEYEGVIPEILKRISKNTGLEFTYLYNNSTTQSELANQSGAEIISGYVTDSNNKYVVDTVTVFTYNYREKPVNIGFGFTENSSQDLINIITDEVMKISNEEISGYIISATHQKQNSYAVLFSVLVIFSILFVLVLLFVWHNMKNTKKKMKRDKFIDDETGIGNLLYFEYCFNNKISDISRNLYYVVYLIIDSNFLQVYHGESAFTDAVKYIASVLSDSDNHNEFAARITENGFAFAFKSETKKEAKFRINEILDKISSYLESDESNSNAVFYAAAYNLNQSDRSSEVLLFNLRRNCSNLIGKNKRFLFCDTHMMNTIVEEKRLIDDVENGFKNQEFKLYIQFIVDNRNKNIVSAESLSRWESEKKGFMTPGQYIESIESIGLITTFDYYMFDLVCRQLHKWKSTEFEHLTLSCNLTRITLSDDDFIEKISEITNKYIFDKSKLIIEITEDAIEKNRETAMNNVKKCKEMGFKIALDDLGSGYTSLINLCDYPIDIVKIDRDILLKTDQKNGRELFKGIVALAHNLNLTAVCEGVETEEHVSIVSDTDCDSIQGWYFSKVYPVRDSEEFARQYSKNINY